MSDHTPHTPHSRRERLHHAIHHLEHVLPGQAPLVDFVHHNTLHGYQHLTFPEGLKQARQVTGIAGYLPLPRFRELWSQGRITDGDLEAVLRGDAALRAQEAVGPFTRLDLLRIALLHDLTPLNPGRMRWTLESGALLDGLQADVEPAPRARFLNAARARMETESQAVTALWQACRMVLDLPTPAGHVEGLLEMEDEQARSLLDRLPPASASPRTVQALRQEGDRIHQHLMEQVGHSLTLRGLLLAVTGQDLLEELRPYLSRQLGSFLDQGMAPWPLPERERGFYPAWRRAALADPGAWLENLPDWRDTLAELPDDAEAVVEEMLTRMGLPEERWEGYLGRLALELPGWSGMFMWRHLRPGYQGLPQRVEMMDYLAVRLVLERLTALRLCRAQWKLEPRLELLTWHFHTFRAELVMRWHLFNADMPEYLAVQVQMLLRRTEENPARDEEWQHLAHQFLTWRLAQAQEGGVGFSPGRHGWPLFLMAQHLGMDASTLGEGGRPLAEALLSIPAELDEEQAAHLWLQAYERNYRQDILSAIAANRGRGRWAMREQRPEAQLIFCMDDREEGIRRHLEEHNPMVETLGAAGFFGVPMNWRGLDDAGITPLCPVVVTPTNNVREVPRPEAIPLATAHQERRTRRVSWRDRLLRVSHRGLISPALLSLAGAPLALPLLAGKLLAPLATGTLLESMKRAFDREVPTTLTFTAPPSDAPATTTEPRQGFTDLEQANRVEGMLRTMGLTYGFAPLVVFLGHGSISQNNPHLAAYDCGACSGRHGGPNARLFAAMANRPEVRALLGERGIDIPDDTWFLGTEHNTCDEAILWFDLDQLPTGQMQNLEKLRRDLDHACAMSAHERSRRLASAPRRPTPPRALAHVAGRAVDFSQARPELGHVTNAVALIGRRSVTQGVFFDRRMYLISYDPTQDPSGRIVENILLAAGPVGAGISLEYYFSTVDNDRFGCGTKVVHNVTGFLGVMEGTASDLRTGLPKQMIEIHEAMRLLVIVEQTPEILSGICQRQPIIAELVVNAWIQLVALESESGRMHYFRPGSGWEPWEPTGASLPMVNRSPEWYDGHDGPLTPVLIRQPEEVTP